MGIALRSSLALGLVALLGLAAGCVPTCTETCEKVLDCSLDSERVSLDECVNQCEDQAALYEVWEDDDKADLFDEHKTCLSDATCDEIEAGACYDEDLFVF